MPWSEMSPMDQKTQFIADYRRGLYSLSELTGAPRSKSAHYLAAVRFREVGPNVLL